MFLEISLLKPTLNQLDEADIPPLPLEFLQHQKPLIARSFLQDLSRKIQTLGEGLRNPKNHSLPDRQIRLHALFTLALKKVVEAVPCKKAMAGLLQHLDTLFAQFGPYIPSVVKRGFFSRSKSVDELMAMVITDEMQWPDQNPIPLPSHQLMRNTFQPEEYQLALTIARMSDHIALSFRHLITHASKHKQRTSRCTRRFYALLWKTFSEDPTLWDHMPLKTIKETLVAIKKQAHAVIEENRQEKFHPRLISYFYQYLYSILERRGNRDEIEVKSQLLNDWSELMKDHRFEVIVQGARNKDLHRALPSVLLSIHPSGRSYSNLRDTAHHEFNFWFHLQDLIQYRAEFDLNQVHWVRSAYDFADHLRDLIDERYAAHDTLPEPVSNTLNKFSILVGVGDANSDSTFMDSSRLCRLADGLYPDAMACADLSPPVPQYSWTTHVLALFKFLQETFVAATAPFLNLSFDFENRESLGAYLKASTPHLQVPSTERMLPPRDVLHALYQDAIYSLRSLYNTIHLPCQQ